MLMSSSISMLTHYANEFELAPPLSLPTWECVTKHRPPKNVRTASGAVALSSFKHEGPAGVINLWNVLRSASCSLCMHDICMFCCVCVNNIVYCIYMCAYYDIISSCIKASI